MNRYYHFGMATLIVTLASLHIHAADVTSVETEANSSSKSTTIVQKVEQKPSGEAMKWVHTFAEDGDYQIGQAWVHIVDGTSVTVTISINGKPFKTHSFTKGQKIEPYDAPLFRFPIRIEKRKGGDKIEVACTPEPNTRYELSYRLAFGTPTFTGLPVFAVKDYGAKGDGKHNDLPAVWKATAAAEKAGGGIVRFDKGANYRLVLDKPEAYKKKQYVFRLKNSRNLKFEGNGSFLNIHPEKLALAHINECENIQIDGFIQTFTPQPYYQGVVSAIEPEKLYMDIQVPARYGIPEVGKARQAMFFARSLSDPIKSPVPDYISCGHLYIDRTESLSEQPCKIRVHFRKDHRAKLKKALVDGVEGNPLVMPHQRYGHSSGEHLCIESSGRISMTNLWIQSIANFGIVPKYNWGPVTFSKVDIRTPKPKTERFVSWRDGFHVRDNRMGILIEDGRFDGGLMYDDIFSPHSMLNKVEKVKRLAGGRLEVTLYGLSPMFMYKPGDWLSAWDPKQKNTGKGIARVVETVQGSETRPKGANHRFLIRLDRTVDLRVGDFLFHEETINWDMVIRRCINSKLGKHGSTRWRTPVSIEDCQLDNISIHIYGGNKATLERPRPRHIVFKDSIIGERTGFHCNDAWDVSLQNLTIDSAAQSIFKNSAMVNCRNVSWKNASKVPIVAKDGTTIRFFGRNSINGEKKIQLRKHIETHDSKVEFMNGRVKE